MSPNQERTQLDIVIVGGGICGLACAVALKHFGVEAHVYEAAVCDGISSLYAPLISILIQTKFGEIGAAIGVGTCYGHEQEYVNELC
jgi:2-polyprenyl-6-methoxyphenol hydroxylase-like FAD-dependent oxidoreductase